MTIKYIIDDRSKKVPSIGLISRIEIFLNYNTSYEVSLQNQGDLINYVAYKVGSSIEKLVEIQLATKVLIDNFIEQDTTP